MKNLFVILAIIILVLLGIFAWNQGWFGPERETFTNDSETDNFLDEDLNPFNNNDEETESTDMEDSGLIGQSSGGHGIEVSSYGNGDTELLFVGGIHGAYSANTVLLSYRIMEWLEENPEVVPENITVTVIPMLNPDGVNEVFGSVDRFVSQNIPSREERVPGRFNANGVDLNRNFDCNWQSVGVWQDVEVDGGSSAFSEPEARALRSYVESNNPEAVVIFYSAAGEVVASSCNGEILSETGELVELYANASGYTPKDSFDYYQLTGDAANWLAKIGVPTVSVILESHNSVEWSENRAGIEALMENYRN